MSVRVGLEAEAVTVTRLDRNRSRSDVQVQSAESSAAASQESEGSDFRDSLRAHLKSQNSGGCSAKVDGDATADATSSSSSAAATNGTDCRNPDQSLVTTAAGKTEPNQTSLNRSTRKSQAGLLVHHHPQISAFKIKEDGRVAATSVRESLSGDETIQNANHISPAPDGTMLFNPVGAVTVPDQTGPIGSAAIAQSKSIQPNPTGSVSLLAESNTDTSSFPPTTPQVGQPQSDFSNKWQALKSDARTLATRANEAPEDSKSIDAGAAAANAGSSSVVLARPPVLSSTHASPGSQIVDAGTQSVASDLDISVMAIGNEKQASLEQNSTEIEKVASATVPTVSSLARDQVPIPGKSIDASGNAVQSTPNIAAPEAVRDDKYPADANVTISAVAANDVAGKLGIVKSFSSRSAQSGVNLQKPKNTSVNSTDKLAPDTPDSSRIVQLTNAESRTQKSTEATAIGSRMQNFFSALEPNTRNDAGAFNWTRTGHMQAEAEYQDPALGWIGIRAEVSRGAVHATLVPSSPDAARVLGVHIAGLHTHLAENNTPVETLTLSPFGGNAQHSSGQHSGQGSHHGTGENASHSNAAQTVPQTQTIARAALVNPARGGASSGEPFIRSDGNVSSEGLHISVLA